MKVKTYDFVNLSTPQIFKSQDIATPAKCPFLFVTMKESVVHAVTIISLLVCPPV